MKSKPPKNQRRKKKVSIDDYWERIHPNAAGIDLSAREHWVAVPPGRAPETVRPFGASTPDLEAMGEWLKACGVTTVAMEATGVYWVAPFQVLERLGFAVLLVNARQIKNVSGRKTDILDCQWIQRLHTFGLLGGSFRPADPYCVVRSLLRYQDELIAARSTQIHHMQKALLQMNLQLSHVISDLSGQSGLAIVEAILQGKRDPIALAALAHRRIKSSRDQIAKALIGDYRAEHIFVLRTAWELFKVYEEKIAACDEELAQHLDRLPNRVNPQAKPLPPKAKGKKLSETLRLGLYLKLGVDLTAIESLGTKVALIMLTEVGPDLGAFPTVKHFASWLGLCPDHRISGGKILRNRTRKVINRLAAVLRLSATALERSQSALGGFYRRMKARLGAPQAITATAHKLACLIYRLVKHGEAYVAQGLENYEKKHKERKLKQLQNMAASMGMQLIQNQPATPAVS